MSITQIQIGQTRLLFGRDSVKGAAEEVKRLGGRRPLVVTDAALVKLGLLEKLEESLRQGELDWACYDRVMPDPASASVDEAVRLLREEGCDCVIGIGGGSVMDTAKCTAAMAANGGSLLDYDHANTDYREFEKGSLPLISIPTTAGTGSELSPYAVITNEQAGRKATIGSPMLYADAALVDPSLTLGLPKGATAATGSDALAHCIEAYTSVKSAAKPNLIIDGLVLQGVNCLCKALPGACEDGSNYELREQVMWGSTIGGFVLQYGSGAAHGLANVLGGELHVPHGNAIGMLLPHVVKFNRDVCRKRYARLAAGLGLLGDSEEALAKTFAEYIREMFRKLSLPSLASSLKETDRISELAELALKDKCTRQNCRPLTREDACCLYKKAYHGNYHLQNGNRSE